MAASGPPPATTVLDTPSRHAEAAAPEGWRVGARVQHWLIERLLGRGGMGSVFLARDLRLDRQVALKVLGSTRSGGHPGSAVREEARAMAALTHPNIVALYEIGKHEGHAFLVMEYVKGQSLRTHIGSRRPSLASAHEWLAQCADALHQAHVRGLVHRDFKPENVIVDARGQARVLDFGIAAWFESGENEPGQGLASVNANANARVPGTPHYMSPEQKRGEMADPRSDQYAFCVTAVELLTGRHPAHATELEALPHNLSVVLQRGLDPEPSQRWPSMSHLRDALFAASRNTKHSLRSAATVTGIAVGALLVALAWRNQQQSTATKSAGSLASSSSALACAKAGAAVDGAWTVRARARAAQDLARRPDASPELTTTALDVLDTFARAYGDASQRVCELSSDAPIQVERARQRACLGIARSQFIRTLDLLPPGSEGSEGSEGSSKSNPAHPGADVQIDATNLAASLARLPQSELCLDSHLDPMLFPLQGGEALERAQRFRETLEASKLELAAGMPHAALQRLNSLESERAELNFPPLSAELDFAAALARVEVTAPDHATRAAELDDLFERSLSLGHDALSAELALELAYHYGLERADPGAGAPWLRRARASARGRSVSPSFKARATNVQGILELYEARPAAAIAAFRSAYDELPPGPGQSARRVQYVINRASAHEVDEDTPAALSAYRQAYAVALARFGPAHTLSAQAQMGIASTLSGSDPDASLAEYRGARAIFVKNLGADSDRVAAVDGEMCSVLVATGALDEAELACQRAHQHFSAASRFDPISLQAIERILSDVRVAKGEFAAAQNHLERAIELQTESELWLDLVDTSVELTKVIASARPKLKTSGRPPCERAKRFLPEIAKDSSEQAQQASEVLRECLGGAPLVQAPG